MLEMLESSYMAPLIRCDSPVMPRMRYAHWLVPLMRYVYHGMQRIRFGGAEESM